MALITGVPGWLGSALANHLADKVRLRALVMPGQRWKGDHTVGDLTRPESLPPFFANSRDAVLFHCAGLPHPKRVDDFYQVHVEGTRHLLAQAARAGVKRAVVVSSNSPVGVGTFKEEHFDENTPYRPYMHYGRSKMLMEELTRKAAMETVIVRPPWFYGPGGPERQQTFFRMIARGTFPLLGDGANLRSMVYIDNLVRGMELCATHPSAAGRTYWLADSRPYSFNEIVFTIHRLLSEEFAVPTSSASVRLPSLLGEMATWIDRSLQRLGLYHQKIHVLGEVNKTIACSIEHAKRDLGYSPSIDLEEGMRRTLSSAFKDGLVL